MQLQSLAKSTEVLNKITSVLNNTELSSFAIEKELDAIGKSYTTDTLKTAIAQSTLNKEHIKLIMSANGLRGSTLKLTTEELFNATSTNKVAASQATAAGTTSGLGYAFKGLGIRIKEATLPLLKFLFTNPAGWATLAVTAIAGVVAATAAYNKKLEEQKQAIREAADEAKSAINSIKSDFDTLASDTNNIKKRYAALAQGVENLGKANQSRGRLSTEDYQEFLDLSNQLYKLFPQLAINFDNNGNAILNLSGNVDTIVGSLENLVSVQQKLANQEILEKIPGVWSGYMLDIEDYKKSLSDVGKRSRAAIDAVSRIGSEKTLSLSLKSNDKHEKELNRVIMEALSRLGYGNPSNYWNKMQNIRTINIDMDRDAVEPYDLIDWDFSSLDESQFEQFKNELGRLSQEYENAVMFEKSKFDSANTNMASYINTWLSTEWNFNKLDSNLQNAAKSMLFNGDWVSLIPDTVDSTKWDEVGNWIQQEFLFQLQKAQDNEEISRALSEVFSNAELTLEEKASYIKQIQDYFGEESMVTILLHPQLETTTDTAKALKKSIRKLTDDHGMTDREAYSYLMEEVDFDNFTLQQAELWLKATQGAENAKQAVEMYRAELDKAAKADNQPLSLSETIDQLNAKIKPAFDSLESAWKNIFTEDGFALNSIDILSTCDSIKSKLDELNNIDGITVDYSSYEDFVRVLRNSESTEKEVQDAFDALATSITQVGLSGKEDFETMKAALEDLGVVNNEIVAFDALISNTWALKEAGLDLANATEEEITGFVNEKVSAENAAQAIKMLIFQKELCNLQEMNSVREVAHLRTLAKNAGYTGEAIQYLTELTLIYSRVARGYYGTEGQLLDDALVHANELKQLITESSFQVAFDFEKESAGSAGKDAAKSFTDALDKELTALDKKMEAGYIDFNDYIQARLKLIESYYKQGKLSADEYYSYLEKHYDTQLSYMDKVVSAVTRRIDTEIDTLKQQKEDVESLYKVQIESLEKQKNLLEEANQERQRQIDLQKALYDLERARNQRTKLVYSEDKGMHYVADDHSIRDARKNADDAKYNNQIAEIAKSISKLEEARDQETSAIDAMISNLEEYKDAWSDITSAYKEEQEDLIAAQFFGADWESKILNGRLDVLEDFKEQYIRIQQEIAAAAAQETVNEQVGATGKDNSGSEGDQKKKKKALETLKTPIQRLSSSLASSLTSSLPTQNQSILSHIQTYGSGTNNAKKGLNLVGEDGAEAYFDNHGHVAIVTKPTLIPMEGGEIVKNEHDTKELLDPDNLASADTIGLADIDGKEARYTIKVNVETNGELPNIKDASLTKAETVTLSDGTVLTPLQPEGRMFELQQKFDAYMDRIAHNVDMLSADIAREHSRQMQEITNPVTNSSTVNNRNMQPVVSQNITLNCPNVTNNSGIEYIRKELGHLSLRAMQESMK